MSVTFFDDFLAVKRIGFGVFIKDAFVCTETKGTAEICHIVLIRHNMDDRMCCVWIQLGTVCICITQYMAGKLNDCHLHTKAETKKWYIVCTGVFNSGDLAFDTSVTKTAGNENTIGVFENIGNIE